jgi:hypothetical protein
MEVGLEKLSSSLYTRALTETHALNLGCICQPIHRNKGQNTQMKPKLKVDLHMHSLEWKQHDPDKDPARQLIDVAHQQGLDVISITDHNVVTYNKELVDYATERGILLIPGMEATIQKKHVLLYNFNFSGNRIESFEDIKRLKRDDNLCLAPHPFYPSLTSLKNEFDRHRAIFDGLELCHFYSKRVNFNKKAIRKSRQYGLPLVGMSDAHMASQLGVTYSLVEADKEIESVILAIKEGRVEVVSQPLGVLRLGGISFKLLRDELLSLLTLGKRNHAGK